ncbi:MAG: ester cyclase [Gaiellaceae bacterium]
MGAQAHKDAIEAAVELWNAHDERYFELYTEDAASHGLPPDVPPNVDGLRGMFRQMWSAFPDIRIETQRLIVEGDLTAIHVRIRGTHEGEFMGAAPTGKEIDVQAMAFLRFGSAGKVVERWTRLDEMALLTQLGLMPAPAATSA